MWKCRTVENEENQNQASLVFHRPWKSLRDSHIPTTPTTILPFPNQNQKTRKEPQLRRKPQPPSLGSSFDEKMLSGSAGGRLDSTQYGRRKHRGESRDVPLDSLSFHLVQKMPVRSMILSHSAIAIGFCRAAAETPAVWCRSRHSRTGAPSHILPASREQSAQ